MSDKDLIGVSYKDAHTLYLDINFDVLRGCTWQCEGCFVDKNGQGSLSMSEYVSMSRLLHDAQSHQYRPLIATVGPTDIFSATNAVEFLSNHLTVDLLSRFERLSFTSTFLNFSDRNKEIVQLLNEHFPSKAIEVNITFEMRHMHSRNYLERVEKNRLQTLSLLTHEKIGSHALFNVFDYSQTKISALLEDYEALDAIIRAQFQTDIDFNFSIGRKTNLSQQEFQQAADQIKRIFNTNIHTDSVKDLRFSVGRLTDSLVERQYNFRNGKLYYSPMFYERYVSFAPHYELPMKRWTMSEIEEFETNLIKTQYISSASKECNTCRYLGSCVDRGILHMMEEHQLTQCILAKDAMDVANNHRSD